MFFFDFRSKVGWKPSEFWVTCTKCNGFGVVFSSTLSTETIFSRKLFKISKKQKNYALTMLWWWCVFNMSFWNEVWRYEKKYTKSLGHEKNKSFSRAHCPYYEPILWTRFGDFLQILIDRYGKSLKLHRLQPVVTFSTGVAA